MLIKIRLIPHAHGVNLGALIGMRVMLIGMYGNCEIPMQVDPKSKSNLILDRNLVQTLHFSLFTTFFPLSISDLQSSQVSLQLLVEVLSPFSVGCYSNFSLF